MPDFFMPAGATIAAYSPITLLGFLTVSLLLALVVIAMFARAFRAYGAAKDYQEAIDKMDVIEQQFKTLMEAQAAQQQEYEKNLCDLRDRHAKEIFALQQTIFERNSEIIDLKTDLLEMSKHTGNYHYDTITQ